MQDRETRPWQHLPQTQFHCRFCCCRFEQHADRQLGPEILSREEFVEQRADPGPQELLRDDDDRDALRKVMRERGLVGTGLRGQSMLGQRGDDDACVASIGRI
jgi:hypothetical protein